MDFVNKEWAKKGALGYTERKAKEKFEARYNFILDKILNAVGEGKFIIEVELVDLEVNEKIRELGFSVKLLTYSDNTTRTFIDWM